MKLQAGKGTRKGKDSVRFLIREYLPDFCWLTAAEVFFMLEPLDWELEHNSVSVVLISMGDRDEIDCQKKHIPQNRRRGPHTVWHYKAKPRVATAPPEVIKRALP